MMPARRPRIEQIAIHPVPQDQRHGGARSLFTLWFGSNTIILTVATGALAPSVFHLPAIAAALAILAGNLVGAVFMALHAVQGPQLGIPQMVQTRAQFGSYGALAIIAVVVVMYVGFVASNLVLAGQSLHAVFGGAGGQAGLALVCLVSLAAAVFGHDLIHAYAHAVSWASAGAIAASLAWIVAVHPIPAAALHQGSASLAGILGVVSTSALWQISYAPYVADYARYLPQRIGAASAFWACYLGSVLGSVLPMLLGVVLVLASGLSVVGAAFARLLGPLSAPVLLVFTIAIVVANAMNLYCGALATLTVLQTLRPRSAAQGGARIASTLVLGIAAAGIGLLSAGSFLQAYTDFLQLLLCVLVPWTAINLVDYYLVSHGAYDMDALFQQDGGRYGRFNLAALGCYALGIAVQAPFLVTGFYTGPAAAALGRVDLSWIVGLLVVAPLYWATQAGRLPAGRRA